MKKLLITLLILITLGCKSTPEGDKTIGTSLLGVIYDGRSNPVQNASLQIKNLDGELLQTIKSDINGKFYLNELPFNEYKFTIRADRVIETTIDVNHYDIENVLILRVKTFDDRVRDMENALKKQNWDLCQKYIKEIESIDDSDIYFTYLKAIYYVKTDKHEDAEFLLLPYKDQNYPYIELLLEDINSDKLN